MKSFKCIPIFLVALRVLGSVSRIWALQLIPDNSKNTPNKGVNTIYVTKNGTDRNDGLTPAHPKRNIANALRSANPGDNIHVGPGTYKEKLLIE